MYDDVSVAFIKWNRASIRVFTYASGTVLAQQLLMRKTVKGNLRPLIDGYFDVNTIGKKISPESYLKIAEHLNESRQHILFLSDNIKGFCCCFSSYYIIIIINIFIIIMHQKKKIPF